MGDSVTSVLIGLGSNQGCSTAIVQQAIERLRDFALPGTYEASRLWRTSPVDCPPDSGDFINAVVGFEPEPEFTPESLLRALKSLEKEFGRGEVYVRNAPRELDLDLLLFGSQRRCTEAFTLPHPRAVDRKFVLAPAAEIAGALIWPETGRSIAELLEELQTDESVVPL